MAFQLPDPSEPLGAPPGDEQNRENVRRRHPAYPDSGFGKLWHKQISAVLQTAESPAEVMRRWRGSLAELWPDAGELYLPERRLRPGELLGIDVSVGPVALSTGVLVIEASDTAMTLLAPEGHMFAGWNRLACEPAESGVRTSVTIEMRANDPLYELGLVFGGHRAEERFWAEHLWNLGALYGQRPRVRIVRRLADGKRKWSHASNIRHNALLRTWARRARKLAAQ